MIIGFLYKKLQTIHGVFIPKNNKWEYDFPAETVLAKTDLITKMKIQK